MKKTIALIGAVVVAVIAGVALADRTDVWLSNSVQVRTVVLHRLTDGGCSVDAIARFSKSDGGTVMEHSDVIEISGANRVTCLDVMTRAEALFKSQKGL